MVKMRQKTRKAQRGGLRPSSSPVRSPSSKREKRGSSSPRRSSSPRTKKQRAHLGCVSEETNRCAHIANPVLRINCNRAIAAKCDPLLN